MEADSAEAAEVPVDSVADPEDTAEEEHLVAAEVPEQEGNRQLLI